MDAHKFLVEFLDLKKVSKVGYGLPPYLLIPAAKT